jgi:CDP-glucose 4,6-dehydratase
MRALMAGNPIVVRNPHHVRPWQHVLESLRGYLMLAARLMEEGQPYAEAWNFAPAESGGVTAQMVVEKVIDLWGSGEWVQDGNGAPAPKETATLRLNWDKAANRLGWHPLYTWEEALSATVDWFRWFQKRKPQSEMYDACVAQIVAYSDKGSWSL